MKDTIRNKYEIGSYIYYRSNVGLPDYTWEESQKFINQTCFKIEYIEDYVDCLIATVKIYYTMGEPCEPREAKINLKFTRPATTKEIDTFLLDISVSHRNINFL